MDLKRTPREFNVGEHVYLKVKSKKSSLSLGRCSKPAPRYCGPFEVLAKIGPVAYQLALPPNIQVHDVFHISLLKIYIHDATHIIDWDVIQVEPEGEFQTEPFRILDRKERMLWNQAIIQIKVQWKHFIFEEATWEMEDKMREAYPSMFQNEQGSSK